MFFIFKSNLDQFGRVKSSPLLDGYPPLPEHFIKQYAFLGIYKMGCPKKTTFQHYKMHKVFFNEMPTCPKLKISKLHCFGEFMFI